MKHEVVLDHHRCARGWNDRARDLAAVGTDVKPDAGALEWFRVRTGGDRANFECTDAHIVREQRFTLGECSDCQGLGDIIKATNHASPFTHEFGVSEAKHRNPSGTADSGVSDNR
jgi:hypothetical protein